MLLNGALNFLDHLEKNVPPSAGKWEIKTEVSIHLDQISENGYNHSPPSSRVIFHEEIEIHGFIDLVYEYENIRILGELKTGSHDAVKEENWCRQVAVYADLWGEKNPEHRLACVAIHVRLTDGFKFFEPKGFEWNSFQNKDLKVGGPQCRSCSIRLSCLESESNISFSAFN